MPDNILEAARFINVGLITLTAVFLAVRFNDLWSATGLGGKMVFGGIAAYFFIGGAGSAEAYLQMAQTGIRSPAASVACSVICLGLWLSRRDPWLESPANRD